MKKLLTFLMMSVLAIGVGWAETATLPNTQALTTNYAYVGNENVLTIEKSVSGSTPL